MVDSTATIREWDEESLAERVRRHAEVQRLFNGIDSITGSACAINAVKDAENTYINGMFTACILISSSYLENMQRSIITTLICQDGRKPSRSRLPAILLQADILDSGVVEKLAGLETLRKYYDSEYPHWTDGIKRRKGIKNLDDFDRQLPKDARFAIECIADFVRSLLNLSKQ